MYAALYSTVCGFSSIAKFVQIVGQDGDLSSWQSTQQHLESLSAEFRTRSAHSDGEKRAQYWLLADDIDKVCSQIVGMRDDCLSFDADELVDRFAQELSAIGIDTPGWPVRVVRNFPSPFDKYSWSAFCPDAEDEKRYGIPKGIYLLEKKIRPFYSTALLAHELIHTVAGSRNPEIFAMGLEEGFTELLGSLYLGSKTLGNDIARNLFIYSRHTSPIRPNWSAYLDHATQLTAIYRRSGLDGLASILNGGREAIREAEKKLLLGRWDDITDVSGHWDRNFDDLIDSTLITFPRSYVLTPLQRYLVDFIREGKTFREICTESGINYSDGKSALEYLGNTVTLFIDDDEKIEFTNLDIYSELSRQHGFSAFRYQILDSAL